jgi:hypothetical protein
MFCVAIREIQCVAKAKGLENHLNIFDLFKQVPFFQMNYTFWRFYFENNNGEVRRKKFDG